MMQLGQRSRSPKKVPAEIAEVAAAFLICEAPASLAERIQCSAAIFCLEKSPPDVKNTSACLEPMLHVLEIGGAEFEWRLIDGEEADADISVLTNRKLHPLQVIAIPRVP
uniref:Uncharacterized protein n=1 Tax=Kalanchoe fedtschenkoi TaxID=63787 RepID=A0A7N0VH97_KALFE